ncbi:MAG: hypothetical protein HY904_16600 [Deltaproteobacteria bacterium]|nr:hypothetical protein [Deltaproteobacteria bacterium]
MKDGGAVRWLAVLVAAGGGALTWGAGAACVIVGLVGLVAAGPVAAVLLPAAGALVAGAALLHSPWLAAPCVLGLVAHGLDRRSDGGPPGWLLLLAGLAGAGLLVLPTWLPVQELVAARPLGATAPVAAAVLSTCVLWLLGARGGASRALAAGVGLAGLQAVGAAAWRVAAGTAGTAGDLLERAARAEVRGQRALQADLVAAAMERSREDAAAVLRIYRTQTHEGDAARLRPEVLHAAARALERSGGPASDVDALLGRSLRRTDPADTARYLDWPGRTRAAASAWRARARVGASLGAPPSANVDDVMECWGGTWCLVDAHWPAMVRTGNPAAVRLRWRKVAPGTGAVRVVVQLGWEGWQVEAGLADDAVAVGGVLEQAVPLDLSACDGKPRDLWVRLVPADGGGSLGMLNKPGALLHLGWMRPPP